MKKLSFSVIMEMEGEVATDILEVAISPENITMPEGVVETFVENDKVITTIKGEMGIGRLINTMDDIIKTAILAKEVSGTTDDNVE